LTRLVLKDPLLDFQVLRAAGSAPYGALISASASPPPAGSSPVISAAGTTSGSEPPKRRRDLRSAPRKQANERRRGSPTCARRATTGTAGVMLLAPPLDPRPRGYNVLAFDGPGQGGALIQQGLTLRPDWENVVRPVVDYALGRRDVDPTRIALIGPSLGAHLAPRAASEEHRLAACIADCGAFDLHAAFLRRLPSPLARGVATNSPRAIKALRILVGYLLKKPTAGWALRRGLLVHGFDEPLDFIESLREYTLAGRAERISCPTWVCSAEGDEISESAPQLAAALTCEKEYVRFTAAEGAGDHCEAGARTLCHARSYTWLNRVLGRDGTT
jgi:dienelactone hydrolase